MPEEYSHGIHDFIRERCERHADDCDSVYEDGKTWYNTNNNLISKVDLDAPEKYSGYNMVREVCYDIDADSRIKIDGFPVDDDRCGNVSISFQKVMLRYRELETLTILFKKLDEIPSRS